MYFKWYVKEIHPVIGLKLPKQTSMNQYKSVWRDFSLSTRHFSYYCSFGYLIRWLVLVYSVLPVFHANLNLAGS